jgi:hypothetical protein
MSTSVKSKKATPRAKKVIAEAPALFIEEIAAAAAPMPPVKKASSSRKPAVVAKVTPDGIQGFLTMESRPLITHLPIHSGDIENDMFATVGTADGCSGSGSGLGSGSGSGCGAGSGNEGKTGKGPNPFDASDIFVNFSQDEVSAPASHAPPTKTNASTTIVHVSSTAATSVGESERPSLPMNYSERLMIRYQDANRDQKLPASTEVACFWDCHAFRGPPCVIPVKIEEDIWHVYGNFCSPECAAAHLFQERLDLHVQWERYALLNRLYTAGASSVRLAAARTVLRLFGGILDITEFRALTGEHRMRIDVMTPPMISITQVMDTKPIDFYDATVKNNFIPWEMDRMNRPGAQGLRLRRTKPIAEKEATLEFCMGITS